MDINLVLCISPSFKSSGSNLYQFDKDFRKTEARKNGPIKALQPAIAGSDNKRTAQSRTMSQDSARPPRYPQHTHISKDDILMTHSQTKEKIKANPYATIKMWRPTSTENSTISSASAGDVYQSFTNFDALRNIHSNKDFRKGTLPPPDDFRNTDRPELFFHGSLSENLSLDQRDALSQGQLSSRTDLINHKVTNYHEFSSSNGYEELPADYSTDSSHDTVFRRISLRDDMPTDASLSKEVSNGNSASFPPPPPLPSSPTFPSSPQMSSFTPTSKLCQSTSTSSVKDHHDNVSYQIVSDGTTNSIKLVLSHSYTDIDLVSMDLERLLAELKLTMDSLKTSRVEKHTGQLLICLSELHSHIKQFIQEAKLVVSSANNSQEKMINQLKSAVHTLAHVFLHGQATMLLMTSSDHALHLGYQIIKTVNSFKSTINAASLALGKNLNDPNMKYLMRQAQNLAALLASLINIIKEVET